MHSALWQYITNSLPLLLLLVLIKLDHILLTKHSALTQLPAGCRELCNDIVEETEKYVDEES